MTLPEAPVAGDADTALGDVKLEIGWDRDRLRIIARGAGRAAVTRTYVSDNGEDVIVEIAPGGPDEPYDFLPGAD